MAGEYVVNLHYYADHTPGGKRVQVPVHVWASVKKNSDSAPRVIVDRTVTLERVGDETTAFRFQLGDRGELVEGSVSDRYKALRAWKGL